MNMYIDEELKNNDLETVMDYEEDELDLYDDDDDVMPEEDFIDYDAQIVFDIISESCGKDEAGVPKAAITLNSEMWAIEGNKSRTIATQSTNKPEIQIQKHLQFIQVDVKFPSHLDTELKVMWNALERYGSSLNDLNDRSTEVPFLSLSIVPLSRNGSNYIVCINPVFWALQPSKPGEPVTNVRLYFNGEDMGVYETDEINMQDVEAAAQREVQQQELAIEAMERKQQERDAYDEERNRRIEEMRRSGQL